MTEATVSRLRPHVDLARMRGRKLARLAMRPSLWRAARRGVFPALEHASVPFSEQFGTVLDVGASRGQFALFAASRWSGARIVCFEPLKAAQESLRQTAASIGAEVHPVALSQAAGARPLHVSGHDDSSSLLPIGRRQAEEFPGTAEVALETVTVETLAQYLDGLPGPILLKIDVQGGELDVLTGAGAALDLVDECYVESSFVELYGGQALADDVVVFLRERGLRLAGVFGAAIGADGTCLQADFLFRR